MINLLKRYPFFLFLLPLFIVIHIENEFDHLINYKLVYGRILILFAMPFVFIFICSRLLKNKQRSALMAFVCLLIFYFTGDFKNWLLLQYPNYLVSSYILLMPVILLIILLFFLYLKKTRAGFSKTFSFFNLALLLFIVADILGISAPGKSSFQITSPVMVNNPACDSCIKPDVYFIVFDSYNSTKYLDTGFSYSNSNLEENLKQKGFKIIENSKSNYNYTVFSLSGTMNMNYIDGVDTTSVLQIRPYFQCLKLFHKNFIFSFFQKENYRILNHSVFDVKGYPANIEYRDLWDVKIMYDQYNLFSKVYQDLGQYLPGPFKKKSELRQLWDNADNRTNMDSMTNHLLLQAARLKSEEPKFVYAHFMRPHPPYFYDSLGNVFTNDSITEEEVYIHQIAYSNTMIKKMTDSILVNATRPLAIIIQGDHGFVPYLEKDVKKVFSNFNAFYFSNKDNRHLHDSLTNVNTFRVVLNTFFNTKLEMLPDRFYYMKF